MASPASSSRVRRTSPARSRKRPQRRNAEETRERILQAAITEFSEKGFSGARVESICRAAQVNPRMIYHYFGDKSGLYVAVLESALADLRREELKLDVDHVRPFDGMMQLFDFIRGHFASHRDLIQLLSGENLLRARYLRLSKQTPIISSPVIGLIDQLLRRGVETGEFRAGIDPLQLYVAMVALSYFHISNAHTLSVIFETDILTPAWQADYHRLTTDLLRRYLRDGGDILPAR